MQQTKTWQHPEPTGGSGAEVSWPQRDVAQITLTGEHDLATSASLERTIEEALKTASHLVIDLKAVEFIDSSVIHVLVRACRLAEQTGVGFNVVIGTGTVVLKVLEVTDLLGALNVTESLEDALRSRDGSHNGPMRTTPTTARPEGHR